MNNLKYKTNINCGSCIAKVTPYFDNNVLIQSWKVDTTTPDKILTVDGNITDAELTNLVETAGFKLKEQIFEEIEVTKTVLLTYYPLLLIAFFITLVSVLCSQGNLMLLMRYFMAGFFLVFSFFKLLDVNTFANSFRMYDIIAAKSTFYAKLYPFIEFVLGVLFLINFNPQFTNWATLIIMAIGIIGVIQSVLNKKKIQCACLGSVFNLPMSTVTIIEDGIMIVMSIYMLIKIN